MSAKQIQKKITNLATNLLGNDIAIDYNPASISSFGAIDQISWSKNGKPNSIHSVPYATMSDYRRIIENRQYNIMLYDGAIIQIFIELRRGDLNRHSLSYYPCPIRLTQNLLETEVSIIDLFDTHLINALDSLEWTINSYSSENEHDNEKIPDNYPILTMKTPFRFDYDIDEHGNNHPVSHLHISDQHCRLPVFAPLSLGHFIRFIFMNFYRQLWNNYSFLHNFSAVQNNRSIKTSEECDLYLDCR